MLSGIKSKLVSWLLRGVHIDRLEVGEHTVTIDGNNITLPGTVDGVDVSAHAANADAHHARSHDHSLAADGTPIAVAGVPNLDAAKITMGRFGMPRMPDGTSGQVLTAQGAGVDPAYAAGGLDRAAIGALNNSYRFVSSDSALAYNGGGDVVEAVNGDLLITYRTGTTDGTDKGTAVSRRSTDRGKTWGAETLVYSHATRDVQEPQLIKLANNTILCSFWLCDQATGSPILNGLRVIASADNGVTWGAAVAPVDAFTLLVASGARIIQKANGDLLWAIFGKYIGDTYYSSHTLKSTDNGVTWGSEVVIADGQAAGRTYSDPWLVITGGNNILALIRSDSAYPWSIYGANSADGGVTWGAKTVRFLGNATPATIKLTDGRLLCCYRRFQRPPNAQNAGVNAEGMFAVFRLSYDSGVTWGPEVRVDVSDYFVTSGCFPLELSDGIVVVVYFPVLVSNTTCHVRFRYLTIPIAAEQSVKTVDRAFGCRIYNSANISIPTATAVALTLNSERWDTDTMHETDSDPTYIFIRTAGKYLVGGNVRWASNATGYRQVFIMLNSTSPGVGGINIGGEIRSANATEVDFEQVNTVYDFAVGDKIELVVVQTSGGNLNINAGLNYSPEFWAIRIGA